MELRHFGTLNPRLAPDALFMVGATPQGGRVIQEIESAHLSGERIRASMKGAAAADWCTLTDNGLARFDIRLTLETDDGALVYLPYTGKADWSANPGQGAIYAVANVESGDERYAWLNSVQVVGKGRITEEGGVDYELYELV